MRFLFNPAGKWPQWSLAFMWALPLLPLLFETDLTALLWLGSTGLTLVICASAREAVFRMVYKDWLTTLVIGVGIGSVVGLVANPGLDFIAENLTGETIDLSQFADVHENTGAYIELLIVALLFGGVVEELCFRGFFIGWGTEIFGTRAAIPLVIVTSVAFAIGHFYQGFAGGISTGLFSLLMGVLYVLLDRKLLPLILVHAVSNFWGVTEIYLSGA